jgi:tetraacyldisaccharide 4'-kinase
MRRLLLPFSWLYGGIIRLRNAAFDAGVLKSTGFEFPVIVVGNLSVGGTGKSPLVLFLAGELSKKYNVAILSRGYGRLSKGYLLLDKSSTARQGGDEPMQYVQALENVRVAVCEDRVEGIRRLKNDFPDIDVVLLDDAYQHRQVKGGLNILLTDFSRPFFRDAMLPAGDLREPVAGKKRAGIIVVTKCPADISAADQHSWREKIRPNQHQSLVFSYIRYREPLPLFSGAEFASPDRNAAVMMVCGIARPEPLQKHLESNFAAVTAKIFPDHYDFSVADVLRLKQEFLKWRQVHPNAVLITTRKDAMRLQQAELKMHLEDLPFFVVDIVPGFIGDQENLFLSEINAFLAGN